MEKAGVYASHEFVEAHPLAAALLADLAEKHLTPCGATRAAMQQLDEARAALDASRRAFFSRMALLAELRDFGRGSAPTKTLTGESVRLPQAATQFLARVIAAHDACAMLPIGDEVHLGDVDPEFLVFAELGASSGAETRETRLHRVNAAIAPLVSANLTAKLVGLAALYGGAVDADASKAVAVAKGVQLPALVHEHIAAARLQEQALRWQRVQLDDRSWEAYKIAARRLEALGRIVDEFMLRRQPRFDAVYVAFLDARTEALSLKLRMLQLAVLAETYTEPKVEALRVIREKLVAAVATARTSLAEALHRLEAFAGIGLGLDAVVSTYSALLQEIANKRWAMTELRTDTRFAFD
eukprot:Amastigsp_a9248_6.p1 type:complete len:355 gc:universal Amastigsp_a9248_6:58-1122(+)